MSTYERLQFDVKVKILMVGDSGVGKSCILLRFADDKFQTTFITTIGVDLKIKTLEIDGKRIKLQIWDTAGQERFQSITSSYYKGADGVMLVLDITKQQSFDNIKKWLANIEMHTSSDVEKILVGNKCDLESKRVIPYERGEQLAEEQKIGYIETSAKTNHNIDEAFHMLVKRILKKVNDKEVTGDRDKVLDLHESENTNKCSC